MVPATLLNFAPPWAFGLDYWFTNFICSRNISCLPAPFVRSMNVSDRSNCSHLRQITLVIIKSGRGNAWHRRCMCRQSHPGYAPFANRLSAADEFRNQLLVQYRSSGTACLREVWFVFPIAPAGGWQYCWQHISPKVHFHSQVMMAMENTTEFLKWAGSLAFVH